MKAIKTTYHGPTDTRGSRITASDTDGNSITIPYPHEFSGAECHAQAAIALCRKMGWRGDLIAGGLRDCYVFTFAWSDRFSTGVTEQDEREAHERRYKALGLPATV